MDDTGKVFGIFGSHRGRSATAGRLRLRDAALVADIEARISDLAARDNRARDAGWTIDVSPPWTDDLTERSLFRATLTSGRHGERRLDVTVGRDWVQIDGGAMESSMRGNARNLQAALESAFRRVVLRSPPGTAAAGGTAAVSP